MKITYDAFMNRPLQLRSRIKHKADDVAFLFEVCTKSTPSLGEKVQSSSINKTDKNYAKWIDADNELKK